MNDLLIWLIEIFRQYNLLVLALLIVLQCNGIPVGANFLVIASGAFAYINGSNIATLGLEVWFFTVLGDSISYWIWRQAGPGLITRFPQAGSRVQQGISRMGGYFTRYGNATVLFTRFPLSALGPLVNISAGIASFKYSVYLGWVLAGESLWTGFNLGIGYWFGDSFDQVLPLITQSTQLVFLLTALAATAYWIISVYRHQH